MTSFARLYSDYLLVGITLSFIGGIGLSPHLPLSLPLLSLLVAVLLAATLAMHLANRSKESLLFLSILFFFVGVLHETMASRPPPSPDHIFNLISEKREAVVIGTLLSMTTFDGRSGQGTIDLQSIRFADRPEFQQAKGKILVRLAERWPDYARPGTILTLRLSLQRPTGFNTPGTFDYPAHLARQGIWITGFLSSSVHVHPVNSSETAMQRLLFLPEQMRHAIGTAIDNSTPPSLNGIYRALVIGDQTQVDDATRAFFRDSGALHILSISGLHFAIISALLFFLVYWLLRRSTWLIIHGNVRKIALLACLPILIFYALVAGSSTPVLRSLTMICTAIFALCIDRRKSPVTIIAAAALLLLIIQPQSLFTVSFQLSFAAVAAISLAVPELQGLTFACPDTIVGGIYISRFLRWMTAALLASTAATLGTSPLLLYHFNQISLVAPLTNIIIEPLICLWSLPCALIAALLLPISAELAATMLHIGAPGLSISLEIMERITALPWSSVRLTTPPLWLIVCFYAILILIVVQYRAKKAVAKPTLAFLACTTLLFFISPYELTKALKKDLTVTFIDIGQGNSTLLEFPGGYRVLVDGGGSSSSRRTPGESVIAPFLWHKGISRLDHIIITHPDADHYNGLSFIIEHFTPESIWTNRLSGSDLDFSNFLQQARKLGIHVAAPTDGARIACGRGQIRCVNNLSSGRSGRSEKIEKSNDSGLIVQAQLGRVTVLFPGDISKATEQLLVDTDQAISSTILLSPHHGSKTSNSRAFFAAVNPEYLVVSAGSNRAGYFPHPDLAQQCEDQNITMMTTAGDGTITAETDGENLVIATFKRRDAEPSFRGSTTAALAEKTRQGAGHLR